jgi:hypothetical protein
MRTSSDRPPLKSGVIRKNGASLLNNSAIRNPKFLPAFLSGLCVMPWENSEFRIQESGSRISDCGFGGTPNSELGITNPEPLWENTEVRSQNPEYEPQARNLETPTRRYAGTPTPLTTTPLPKKVHYRILWSHPITYEEKVAPHQGSGRAVRICEAQR